ncbi:AbrB family transcriptional regulator [Heyndrickxia coagulans]|uniref:AbrB family transcriptional regulator n=1 Tax=Heyndrickxia TaxID=2837504 RepID=UPI0030F87109
MSNAAFDRKVINIGNSVGVIFPPEVLKHLGVTSGEEVTIALGEKGEVSMKKKQSMKIPEGVDPELLEYMSEGIKKYDETFKGLAKR